VSTRLTVRNRQRTRSLNAGRLRQVAWVLLSDLLPIPNFDLGINLVDAEAMAGLNEHFLRHQGATDVLAFDYGEPNRRDWLHAEIFVCVDEAVREARCFRTTWQEELVRYLIHGVLHLRGYKDHHRAQRRRMKQEEDRLLRALACHSDFSTLSHGSPGAKAVSR
jgi:rRNA maturation RNase YbeY